jgi:predicted ArsR family transcriptional regulator
MSDEILKQELEILDHFFKTDQNMTAGQIADHFRIEMGVAKHHLVNLRALGFLGRKRNSSEQLTTGNTEGFVITPLGRDLIMKAREQGRISK